MRKVIQGTRSEKGLENHSVIRSLFETAKRQGKKPHSFFLDLFTNNTADTQAALYRKPVVTSNPTRDPKVLKCPPGEGAKLLLSASCRVVLPWSCLRCGFQYQIYSGATRTYRF